MEKQLFELHPVEMTPFTILERFREDEDGVKEFLLLIGRSIVSDPFDTVEEAEEEAHCYKWRYILPAIQHYVEHFVNKEMKKHEEL